MVAFILRAGTESMHVRSITRIGTDSETEGRTHFRRKEGRIKLDFPPQRSPGKWGNSKPGAAGFRIHFVPELQVHLFARNKLARDAPHALCCSCTYCYNIPGIRLHSINYSCRAEPTICVAPLLPSVLLNCKGWTLARGRHPRKNKERLYNTPEYLVGLKSRKPERSFQSVHIGLRSMSTTNRRSV